MNKVLYKYIREIDGTPYYIGIGDHQRPYAPHNHNGIDLLPKDQSRIIIMETGLSHSAAKILEQYWINFYGRKDIGTGILRNRTEGGEGTNGLKKTKESIAKGIKTKRERGNHLQSAETIAKRVATRKTKNNYGLSKESSAKRVATIKERGKDKQSAETIAKRVATTLANDGYNRSPESYAQTAATRKLKGNHINQPESYKKGWATRQLKREQASTLPSTLPL